MGPVPTAGNPPYRSLFAPAYPPHQARSQDRKTHPRVELYTPVGTHRISYHLHVNRSTIERVLPRYHMRILAHIDQGVCQRAFAREEERAEVYGAWIHTQHRPIPASVVQHPRSVFTTPQGSTASRF